MTQLLIPYVFVDGSTAQADHVNANFAEVVTVVNGAIEDDNIADASITASSKLIDATITGAKIGAAEIVAAHIDYSASNLGVKSWRAVGYAGSGGGYIIRVEKTIALAAVVTEQSFSIDWSAGDCPDGTITFASAPTVTGLTLLDPAGGQIKVTDPDVIAYMKVGTRSTTGCTVLITFSNAPTAGNVVLMALVAGPI